MLWINGQKIMNHGRKIIYENKDIVMTVGTHKTVLRVRKDIFEYISSYSMLHGFKDTYKELIRSLHKIDFELHNYYRPLCQISSMKSTNKGLYFYDEFSLDENFQDLTIQPMKE